MRYLDGETVTDLLYTGQKLDSYINLYWYGSRWYDASLGHFIQPDSLVPNPGASWAYDRYSYSYNNPLKYVDPDGHNPILILIALLLKGIDYGLTGYDILQANKVINNPDASDWEKTIANIEIAMAVSLEIGEPDEGLPVGLPLDDFARYGIKKAVQEANEKRGLKGIIDVLEDSLGENADEILENLRIGTNFEDEYKLLDHFGDHGIEFGCLTEDEYLNAAVDFVRNNSDDLDVIVRKSDGASLIYNSGTGEFAVLHREGYIGTYMRVDEGYWGRRIRENR